MTTFKPYVPKPLVHSPRGESVLANIQGYLIQTPGGSARTTDPMQCVAAIRVCRSRNISCLVYALGHVLGEEAQEFVDEAFLLTQVQTNHPAKPLTGGLANTGGVMATGPGKARATSSYEPNATFPANLRRGK